MPLREVCGSSLGVGWDRPGDRLSGPGQTFASVRGEPSARLRSDRNDAGRVDVLVYAVVVPLDVVEVDRLAESARLEQVTRIGPQHWHLGQLVAVALEVAVIDGVEARKRREQPNV